MAHGFFDRSDSVILKPIKPLAPIGEILYSVKLPNGASFTMLKPGIAFGATASVYFGCYSKKEKVKNV
jgi:hypothetical protein